MAHLGDYAASIVEPLKVRPTDVTLVCATNQRVEVRLTTATHHLLLIIAPETDLAHEVFFLRSLATWRFCASPGDRPDERFGRCIVSRRPVMAHQPQPVAGRREHGVKRWQAGLRNAVSITVQKRFWAAT